MSVRKVKKLLRELAKQDKERRKAFVWQEIQKRLAAAENKVENTK